MKQSEFLIKLNEALDLENPDLNINSTIYLTSLLTLSLISFIDEHFEMQIKAATLREIKTVQDIINIIGSDNIKLN